MNDQQINVVTFSIAGVPGFKSVVANGSAPAKRLNSAFNEIHRRLKEQDIKDALTVAEAIKVIYVSNLNCIIPLLELVEAEANSISTDEFLESGKTLYDANFNHFICSLEEIKQGIEQYRQQRKLENNRTIDDPKINEPILFMCTGSLFGDEPFPLVLRPYSFEEGETGHQGVVSFCRKMLRNTKSWRLSDYLRVTKSHQLDDIKEDILTLDRHIANIDSVVVKEIGPLVKYQQHSSMHSRNAAHLRFNQIAASLEVESEARLQAYIGANCFVKTVVY